MTKRNLVTALVAALENSRQPGRVPDAAPKSSEPPGGDILLNALRNSSTGCDQIMQRRLGALSETLVS